MTTDEQIEEIYKLIPDIKCKGLCDYSCGLVQASKAERERIKEFRRKQKKPYFPIESLRLERGFVALAAMEKDHSLRCPYLKDHRCDIYPVRPAICRIWGADTAMVCRFGCIPEHFLQGLEGNAILLALRKLKGP